MHRPKSPGAEFCGATDVINLTTIPNWPLTGTDSALTCPRLEAGSGPMNSRGLGIWMACPLVWTVKVLSQKLLFTFPPP